MLETYLKIDEKLLEDIMKDHSAFSRFRMRRSRKELEKSILNEESYSSSLENNGIHVVRDNMDQDDVYAYGELVELVEYEKAYTFITKKNELVFVGKNGLNEVAFKTFIKRLFDADILACKALPASF